MDKSKSGNSSESEREDVARGFYQCECGSTEFAFDPARGESICQQCGLVREERFIDPGTEYRYFEGQENSRVRVGAPPREYFQDKGLSTLIDRNNRDSNGNPIPQGQVRRFHRMRQWNNRLDSQSDYNLAFAINHINKMCHIAQFPNIVNESACKIYRKLSKARMTRGHSIEQMTAACIYLACRQCKTPITLSELSDLTKVSPKLIASCCRFVVRRLNLTLKPLNILQYVPKIVSELGLSAGVQEFSNHLLTWTVKRGLLNGRNPSCLAAAAVWAAAQVLGEKCYQKDIAKVAGVTTVALRDRYYEIREKLNLALPANSRARRENKKTTR
ncbi:MAG: transcription initiation factor IIB [Promethearchaeota archaeon]